MRLRFRNTSGIRMSCVRNLQVSRKRGGLAMKTLEGVLGIDDDAVDKHTVRVACATANKRAAISTRCAELDQEMSHLLGVSRAIIESVLFCHQEESNWPLAEPAALKKRFDDIFEVTRYTKALDTIRALRKQRAQDARVDEADMRALQQEKERAESIRNKIRVLRASLAHKTGELDELDAHISRKTKENQALYDAAVRFREVVTQAETLEERLALYTEKRDELRQHITLLDADEAELEARRSALPAELAAARARLDEVRRNSDVYRERRDETTRCHDALLRRHGALQASHEALEHALRSSADELRDATSDDMVAALQLRHSDGSSLPHLRTAITDTAAKLRQALRDADAAAARARAEADEREAALENEWQRQRNELRDVQARHEQTSLALRRMHERMAACEREAASAAPDASAADVDAARADLDAARAADVPAARIDAAAAELARLEAERDALSDALLISHHTAEQRALRVAKERECDAQREALAAAEASCAAVAQRAALPCASDAVAAALADAECAAAEAAAALDARRVAVDQQRGAQALQAQLAADRDARAVRLRDEIAAALGGEFASAAEGVAAATDEIATLQESLGVLEHASEFFQRILRQGRERHVCLACNRALSDGAMPAFVQHVESSLQRSRPEQVAELRADLAAWQTQLARLEAARVHEQQLAELERGAAGDAGAADAALRTATAELDAVCCLRYVLTQATEADAAARARVGDVRALLDDVRALDALRTSVHALERHVGELALDTRGAPPAADVRAQMDALAAAHKKQAARHDALVRERDARREAVAAAERALHAAEMRVAARQRHDAAADAARRRLAELRADAADAAAQRDAHAAAVDAASAPLADAAAALDACRGARRAAEARGATRDHALQKALAQVEALQRRVEAAADAAADAAALAASAAALDEARAARDAASMELSHAERDTHTLEAALRDAQARDANLRDNVRFRQAEREMADVEAQLHALDLDAAYTRHVSAQQAYDSARREENALSGSAAHLRGELQGIEAEVARREAELRDEYGDVDARYVRQLAHMKVAAMANRDLDTYAGALHQAILQYHAIKMEEVNQTLDFLWKKTYQGTDIDTVLVRSDAEGRVQANGLRSYQYRVVMVKDDVELDMRGRCSAGQKVLACILIRLALADSFGVHCGFLALDEPTTNLDRENVEALAASLVEYVAATRHGLTLQPDRRTAAPAQLSADCHHARRRLPLAAHAARRPRTVLARLARRTAGAHPHKAHNSIPLLSAKWCAVYRSTVHHGPRPS